MLSLLHSATYHFANNGNDDHTPAQANFTSTPWQHLARLKTVRLAPGDSILLRRGDQFRESLALSDIHGSPTIPIVVSSYGAASMPPPTITGLEPVSDPRQESGNIMSAPWPTQERPSQLFGNGHKIPMARFPAKGWILTTKSFGDSAFLATAPDSLLEHGAVAMVRSTPWTLEPRTLLRHNKDTLIVSRPAHNKLVPGTRFFLLDAPHAITSGTWGTLASTSRLRWKGLPPNLQASVRDGIRLDRCSWIQIAGLRIEASARRGIQATGDNLWIKDCAVDNPGLYGVELLGSHNRIMHCRISGAGAAGIHTQGKHNRIDSNSVLRTAMMADLGREGLGNGCCGGRAIDISGDSADVQANRIDSTGYHGIAFAGIFNRIEGNNVRHSCLTNDDCGGIYAWNGRLSQNLPGVAGSIVSGNIVADSRSDGPSAHGIYLDDAVRDVLVDSNVVSGNDRGIYLHNTNRIVVTNNRSTGNRYSQLALIHDMVAGPGWMHDNRSEGNHMEGLPGQSGAPEVASQQPQPMPLATFAKDTLCEDLLVERVCSSGGVVLERQVRRMKFGPEQIRNGQFALPLLWSGWPDLVQLSAGTPQECGSTPCLKIAHPGDLQKRSALVNDGSHFSVGAGQWWLVSFTARGDSAGQSLNVVLRQAGKSYAPLAPNRVLQLDTGWKEYRILLQSNAQEQEARVDFMIGSDQGMRWLKGVSVRQILKP